MKHNKSFFSELRDQQLRESLRRSARSRGTFTTTGPVASSSASIRHSRGQDVDEEEEEDHDMWSFEGRDSDEFSLLTVAPGGRKVKMKVPLQEVTVGNSNQVLEEQKKNVEKKKRHNFSRLSDKFAKKFAKSDDDGTPAKDKRGVQKAAAVDPPAPIQLFTPPRAGPSTQEQRWISPCTTPKSQVEISLLDRSILVEQSPKTTPRRSGRRTNNPFATPSPGKPSPGMGVLSQISLRDTSIFVEESPKSSRRSNNRRTTPGATSLLSQTIFHHSEGQEIRLEESPKTPRRSSRRSATKSPYSSKRSQSQVRVKPLDIPEESPKTPRRSSRLTPTSRSATKSPHSSKRQQSQGPVKRLNIPEESPKTPRRSGRRTNNPFASPPLQTCSKPSQTIMQIDTQSQSEHLSNLISEIASSSQSTSSPQTPISIWIQQDTVRMFNTEAVAPDSPGEQEEQEPPTLLESFMAIKTRYESSVRLFAHDLRHGKYQQSTALEFCVRKVVEVQDKVVQCLVYDLQENCDRLCHFKPNDPNEITEESFIKVYPPWQEVPVPGTTNLTIVATDFYQIVKSSDLNLSKRRVKEIHDLPLPNCWEIEISEPLFMNLVPLPIKNRNTLLYQTDRFQTYVTLDALVVDVWTHVHPNLILLKDADNFLSFLEVSSSDHGAQAVEMVPGNCYKIVNIAVCQKLRISQDIPVFSVLRLYETETEEDDEEDTHQYFSFCCRWQGTNSNYSLLQPSDFDIPKVQMKGDLLNIDQIFLASTTSQDERISLECTLKEKHFGGGGAQKERYILVTDESDRCLKIALIFNANYTFTMIPCKINTRLLLKYVRRVCGKMIWDYLTDYQVLAEGEEEEDEVEWEEEDVISQW